MRLFLIASILACVTLAMGTSRETWADTALTTRLWQIISNGETGELESLLTDDPSVVKVRSSDGRGPLWWAHEYQQPLMVQLLLEHGASPDEQDADGKKPSEINRVGPTEFSKQREAEFASQGFDQAESPAKDYHGEELEDEFD
jgi:hypothetical protein